MSGIVVDHQVADPGVERICCTAVLGVGGNEEKWYIGEYQMVTGHDGIGGYAAVLGHWKDLCLEERPWKEENTGQTVSCSEDSQQIGFCPSGLC